MIPLIKNPQAISRAGCSRLSLCLAGMLLLGLVSPMGASMSVSTDEMLTPKEDEKHLSFIILSDQGKEPIIGAVVRCTGATTPVVTDANGRCTARFKGNPSNIKVSVSYIGYKTVNRTIPSITRRTHNLKNA